MANILVVDDQLSMRNMFKAILRDTSHHVDYSVDGAEALSLASKSKKYDLVMADLVMPNMDGIELTCELRSMSYYRETPIFIVSTSHNEQKKNAAKTAGANGWICKPVDKDKILSLVGNTVG